MYITEIPKLRNSSGRDFISDCEFLLLILNAFTADTEEYYPKCYKVYDAKGLQIFYHDCSIIYVWRLQIINID